jgi:glycosyltransferase involved in cell wall biosynthesis
MGKNKKIKWSKRSAKLVTALMCKNEKDQIAETTLDSLKDYCGHLIVYDTGSTDGTQNHLKEYCTKNDMRLDLKEGEFVDFAVSRNVLLDYCDEVLKDQTDKFILQVDAHDVLKNGDKFVEFINNFKGPQTGFYVTQKWWSGSNLDSYYNVRLIRPHNEWRYNLDAIVHEYIMCPALEKAKDSSTVVFKSEDLILYQDRTTQGDSSFKRFTRDKVMLFKKHLEKPEEPRTLFYLAQTCACLGLYDEAYKYYQLRLKQQGFWEEIYHSYFRLGELSTTLKHNWEESFMWYMRAFQHSQRAEPLVKIAEYYIDHNLQGEDKPEWHTAYMYAKMACDLAWPKNQILFRDLACYTYKRYHLLGRAAYYVGRYDEGKESCLKAIGARNLDIDRDNLKFYIDKEMDILESGRVDSPSVVAATFNKKEIRTKDEIETNHDRTKAMNDLFNQVLLDRRTKGKIASIHTLQEMQKLNEGLILDKQSISSAKSITEQLLYGNNDLKTNTRARLKRKLKDKK